MDEVDRDLKPANSDPWYVLMTLYGEQVGEDVDADLHQKNQTAWNTVASFQMAESLRDKLLERGFSLPGRDTWYEVGAEIRTLHEKEMYRRNLKGFVYPGFPEPGQDEARGMSQLEFSNIVVANGFIFTRGPNFWRSVFRKKAWFARTVFAKQAYFRGSRFYDWTIFSGSLFLDGLSFRSARFAGPTFFDGVSCDGTAKFFDCKFADDVYFDEAKFRAEARFESIQVSGIASFQSLHCAVFVKAVVA